MSGAGQSHQHTINTLYVEMMGGKEEYHQGFQSKHQFKNGSIVGYLAFLWNR